jgi:hypothetical protein
MAKKQVARSGLVCCPSTTGGPATGNHYKRITYERITKMGEQFHQNGETRLACVLQIASSGMIDFRLGIAQAACCFFKTQLPSYVASQSELVRLALAKQREIMPSKGLAEVQQSTAKRSASPKLRR